MTFKQIDNDIITKTFILDNLIIFFKSPRGDNVHQR